MSLRDVRMLACVCVMVLMGVACGRDNPAGPGSGERDDGLDGTWAGTVDESLGGVGELRLDVHTTGVGVSGTFDLTFDDEALNRTGTIGGSWTSPVLQMFAHFPYGCTPEQVATGVFVRSWLNVWLTREGDSLSGRYEGFGCVGTIRGEFQLVRH